MAVAMLVDTDRGEYRLDSGYGRVTKVTHEPGKRNAGVEVTADHLRHPLRAWVDTQDVHLWPLVAQAHADARQVAYEIRVVRRRNVDKAKPFAELGNDEKAKDLAWLAIVDGSGAITAEAGRKATGERRELTAPPAAPAAAQEAPAPPTPPTPAAAPSEGPSGPETARSGAPTCVRCGGSLAGAEVAKGPQGHGYVHADPVACVIAAPDPVGRPRTCYRCNGPVPADRFVEGTGDNAGLVRHVEGECAAEEPHEPIPPDDVPATRAPVAEQAPPRPAANPRPATTRREAVEAAATFAPAGEPRTRFALPTRRGPAMAEGRPFDEYNSDGTPNPGSYRRMAAVGFLEQAQRLVVARVRELTAETGLPAYVDVAQVKAIARYLLAAADRTQANVRTDRRVNRMDNSHTRARGAVRTALDVFPVPWGADQETRAAWVDNLADYATALLVTAEELDLELDGPDPA